MKGGMPGREEQGPDRAVRDIMMSILDHPMQDSVGFTEPLTHDFMMACGLQESEIRILAAGMLTVTRKKLMRVLELNSEAPLRPSSQHRAQESPPQTILKPAKNNPYRASLRTATTLENVGYLGGNYYEEGPLDLVDELDDLDKVEEAGFRSVSDTHRGRFGNEHHSLYVVDDSMTTREDRRGDEDWAEEELNHMVSHGYCEVSQGDELDNSFQPLDTTPLRPFVPQVPEQPLHTEVVPPIVPHRSVRSAFKPPRQPRRPRSDPGDVFTPVSEPLTVLSPCTPLSTSQSSRVLPVVRNLDPQLSHQQDPPLPPLQALLSDTLGGNWWLGV